MMCKVSDPERRWVCGVCNTPHRVWVREPSRYREVALTGLAWVAFIIGAAIIVSTLYMVVFP